MTTLEETRAASERFRDLLTKRDLELSGYTRAELRAMLRDLRASEKVIERVIRERFEWIGRRRRTRFTDQRLEANLREVRSAIVEVSNQIAGSVRKSTYQAAKNERRFIGETFARVGSEAGVSVAMNVIDAPTLRLLSTGTAFNGAKINEWAARLGANQFEAVKRAVRGGILRGDTIQAILGEVRHRGFDTTRRDLRVLVNSAHAHATNSIREAIYSENADVIPYVQWVATLDQDTCPVCGPRDGLIYTVKEKRPVKHSVPWLDGPGRIHPQCRCTAVPAFDFRPDTERRASVDGLVPGKTTFKDFLGRMSKSDLNEAVGVTRANLLRSGALKPGDLWTPKGDYRLLAQLVARTSGS